MADDQPDMQQSDHPEHNMPATSSGALDIQSDAQKQGRKEYQPTDPKNMRKEINKKGSWQGDTHYDRDYAGNLY